MTPGGRASDLMQATSSANTLGITALALTTFAATLSGAALGPFFPFIAEDLDTTVALLGQIPALTMLLAALMGLIIGPLADQFGHRRVLVLSLVMVAASTLGTGLSPSYLVLLIVALGGAVGRAAAQPVALAIAGTRFVGDQQRRAISWTTTGMSGAFASGIPILTLIGGAVGWRSAFLLFALFILLIAALAHRSIAVQETHAAARMYPKDLLIAYQPFLQHRPTLGIIGSSVLGNAGVWTVVTYIGAFYVQQHGYSIQQVGLVYFVAGGAVVLGTLSTGGRLGTLSLRPLVVSTRLINAGALGVVLMLPLPAIATMGVFVVSGAVNGVTAVAVSLLLTRESPAGRATTMTLNGSALSLGYALGSALGGLMLALSGYPAVGLCALLLCCASGYLAWWSGRRAATTPSPAAPPAVG